MPELTKKQKRLLEVARKGGNDSVLPLLEAIGELEDTLDSLTERVEEIGDAIKKDPPEDVKVEKVAMRLAAKLALKPYPTKDELVELITPLITEAENILTGKFEEGNARSFVSLKKEISAMMDKMMIEHKRGMDKMYKEHEEMIKEQHEGMRFIYDKVRTMKSGADGKNADEEKIVKNVLAQIKLPEQKPITISDIEGLNERFEKIQQIFSNIPHGRLGMRKVPIVRPQNLTSQVNGVVNTFTLDPDTTTVLGVFGTQFPINFNAGTDWTFSGRTLTLVTAQVGIPQLGQTLWALTEALFYP